MTCIFSIKKLVVITGLIVFIKSYWLESWHCYAGFEKEIWDSVPEKITLEAKGNKFYGFSGVQTLLEEGESEGRSTTGGDYKLLPVMNQKLVKRLLYNAYEQKRDFVFVEFLTDKSREDAPLTKGFLVKCEDFKLVSFHDIIDCSSDADNNKDRAYNPGIVLFKKNNEIVEFSILFEGGGKDIVSLVKFVEDFEGITQEEGVLPSYDFHDLPLHQPFFDLYDYFISYDKTTGLGVCRKDLRYARKSDSNFQALIDHIAAVENESDRGRAIACIETSSFRQKIAILEAILDNAEVYMGDLTSGLRERFDQRIRFDENVIEMIQQINGQVNELVVLPQPEENELLKNKEDVEKRIVKFFDRCMSGEVDHLCYRLPLSSGGADKIFDDFVKIITSVNDGISEPMSDILNKTLLKIVGAGERYEHIDRLKKWVESFSDNSVHFSELSLGGEAEATGGRGAEQDVRQGEVEECDQAAKIINGGKKNVKVIENYLNRLSSLAGKKYQLESPPIHKQALDNVDMILRGCVDDVKDDYTLECLLVEAIVDSRLPSFFAIEEEAAQILFGNKTVDKWGVSELCNWIKYFCFDNSKFNLGEELVAGREFYNLQSKICYSFEFKSKLESFLGCSKNAGCECCSKTCSFCRAKEFLKEMKRLFWSEGAGEINALGQESETYYILQMLDLLLGRRLMYFFNARKAVMIVARTSRSKRAEILQRFFINEIQKKQVFNSMRAEKPSRVSIRQNVSDQYVTVSLFDKENKLLTSINNVTAVCDEGIPVGIGFIELCLLFDIKEALRIYGVRGSINCYEYKGRELKSNSKSNDSKSNKKDGFNLMKDYLSWFK